MPTLPRAWPSQALRSTDMAGNRTVRVLGEVMVDVIVRAAADPAPGSDTPAQVSDQDGGSAANLAAWLADLGVPVELIARVGDDERGSAAVARLAAAGVRLRVAADPSLPTGRCVVIVTPDGERTMLPDPGANAALSVADVDPVGWLPGDHLHASGYSMMREGSRAAALAALAHARAHGLSVSVDASSEAPLLATGAAAFLSWLVEGDLLLANAPEARALTGRADPQESADALARRGLVAVVKAGPDGAFAARGTGRWHAPAVPARAQDTTGAGDAFAAGFLASWTDDGDMEAALGLATRTAARAVSQPGGRP